MEFSLGQIPMVLIQSTFCSLNSKHELVRIHGIGPLMLILRALIPQRIVWTTFHSGYKSTIMGNYASMH